MREKAKSFAIKAHGDQKYGEQPYIVHLEAVVAHLHDYGEQAVVMGYLHDVIEDTAAVYAQLSSEFGAFIADGVAILTDEPGRNRKERKTLTYAKMARVSGELELALVVKAADRLANVQACIANGKADLLKMYKREHSAFRSAVYRPGLCDDLW